MDNAIECVKHFKEKEKRQIDVLIHRQHQFLIVQIMNPVERELRVRGQSSGGPPSMTKIIMAMDCAALKIQ